jgi:O-methyltransferase
MATDTPAQNFRLLRKFIPSSLQPYLRGLRKRLQTSERPTQEPFRTVFPYTQVHRFRQENLLRIAREIDDRAIPGAIVECGVLDGGTAAIMAFGTKRSDRPLHLFDSWEGLPAATEKDGDAEMWAGDVVGSPRRVAAVLRALQISFSRVNFHKGWFDKTFPKANIDAIALLHIDADFYDSVRLTLETWGPHISKGGYIQIDDYSSFIGCRKAVDEYLAAHTKLCLETFKDIAYFIQIPD